MVRWNAANETRKNYLLGACDRRSLLRDLWAARYDRAFQTMDDSEQHRVLRLGIVGTVISGGCVGLCFDVPGAAPSAPFVHPRGDQYRAALPRAATFVQLRTPNHSIQRMGASRSAQFEVVRQRRLAPTADAER